MILVDCLVVVILALRKLLVQFLFTNILLKLVYDCVFKLKVTCIIYLLLIP